MSSFANNTNTNTVNFIQQPSVQDLLRCSYCEKFLSVPPIFSDCENNVTICGRCNPVNGNTFVRQHLYEKIAEYMIFPCAHYLAGCLSKMKFSEVFQHERTCIYKPTNCPYSVFAKYTDEKCNWIGPAFTVCDHLEQIHNGQIMSRAPEINFTQLKSSVLYLSRIMKQLMIFLITYNKPSTFSLVVMVNGTVAQCDAYRCQLEFSDESREHSMILRHSRLENMITCSENVADLQTVFTFDLNTISVFLEKPQTITGRFGIIKKSKKDLAWRGVSNQPDLHVDESLLKELECPICNTCMTPPIVMCTSGHSICSKCRERLGICPTCRNPFNRSRNYTLENLLSVINYPCHYKELGCTFVTTGDKLLLHESECIFKGVKCSLPYCDIRVGLSVMRHMEERHPRMVIKADEIQVLEMDIVNGGFRTTLRYDEYDNIILDALDGGKNKFYMFTQGEDVFRILISYDRDWLKFAVDHFGVLVSPYVYEIELIDTNMAWERLSVSKDCLPMGNDIFGMLNDCLEISESMFSKFINDDDLLFFKILLKK